MRPKKLGLGIQEVAFHRNGISGEHFHAVRFVWKQPEATAADNFVAIVFDEPGRVAVLCVDELPSIGDRNKWRGDDFEPELRAAIAARWPEQEIASVTPGVK